MSDGRRSGLLADAGDAKTKLGIALFEVANADAVQALVRDEAIDCELRPTTSADVYCDEAQAAELKEGYDEMVRLECPTLQHVTYHGPEDAERHVGDLGNFQTDAQGNAVGSKQDKLIKLIGAESVLGVSRLEHGSSRPTSIEAN